MQHPLPSWNIILAHHTLQNSSWLQTCLIPASPWDPLQNSHWRMQWDSEEAPRSDGLSHQPLEMHHVVQDPMLLLELLPSKQVFQSWLPVAGPPLTPTPKQCPPFNCHRETLWKVYAGFHTGFLSGGGEDSMLNDSQLRPTKKPHFMAASYIQGRRKQGP